MVGSGIACAAERLADSGGKHTDQCQRTDAPGYSSCPPHRMRTQVNNPPIQAASGNAAMIAAISSHSAAIRTSGVNLVIGTSSAAKQSRPRESGQQCRCAEQRLSRRNRLVVRHI